MTAMMPSRGTAGEEGEAGDMVQAGGAAPPRELPLTLDLRDRRCLCVGGGTVAARRIPALLAAGGQVVVIAPDLHPDLEGLARAGALVWHPRRFSPGDTAAAFLVLAATGVKAVDEAVAGEARAAGNLVCTVARADLGNCRFMSTIRRGRLVVAVQTGGASPAVSAALRSYLEQQLPPHIGDVLDTLADLRRQAQVTIADAAERTSRWHALVASGEIARALGGDSAALERIRGTLLAPGDPSPPLSR